MTTELSKKLDPHPITLTGKLVRLEPLNLEHTPDLYDAGADDAIWRYLPRPGFAGLEDAEGWVRQCLAEVSGGSRVAFAVVDLETGKAIGSTSYLDIDRPNRALEIGWTWYGTAWQRTGVNTECKYLLMQSRLRGSLCAPGLPQDRQPERKVAARDPAAGRGGRGHLAQPPYRLGRG